MLEIDPLEDDMSGTVFRDVIMLVLAGFVVTVLLLLPHIKDALLLSDTGTSDRVSPSVSTTSTATCGRVPT